MNWDLIWTPSYMPTLQPTELLWAFSKGRVAKRFETDRSVEETRMQFFDALYGDANGKPGYTPELCQKLFGTVTSTFKLTQVSGVQFLNLTPFLQKNNSECPFLLARLRLLPRLLFRH